MALIQINHYYRNLYFTTISNNKNPNHGQMCKLHGDNPGRPQEELSYGPSAARPG